MKFRSEIREKNFKLQLEQYVNPTQDVEKGIFKSLLRNLINEIPFETLKEFFNFKVIQEKHFEGETRFSIELVIDDNILETGVKKKLFCCDGCGNIVYDSPHKDYDENNRPQRGIELCTDCKYGD